MTQTLRHACTVAPDHPAFAGHFPGRPLLPGALLLAEIVEAACTRPELADRFSCGATLAAAKFMATVAPGARLEFTLDWDDSTLHFHVEEGPLPATSMPPGKADAPAGSGPAAQSGRLIARGHWTWQKAAP